MLCVVYRAGADVHREVLRGVVSERGCGVREGGVREFINAGLRGTGLWTPSRAGKVLPMSTVKFCLGNGEHRTGLWGSSMWVRAHCCDNAG